MKYNDEELKKMVKKASFDELKEYMCSLERVIQNEQDTILQQQSVIDKLKDEVYDLQCESEKLNNIVESKDYEFFKALNNYIEYKFDKMLNEKNPCEDCHNYDTHCLLEY